MAMPVVNANARAKTRKIFFMAISPLDDEVARSGEDSHTFATRDVPHGVRAGYIRADEVALHRVARRSLGNGSVDFYPHGVA